MDFNDKLNIAGELRLVQALSRGAENHVGDDNLTQAIEAAEQANAHLQEALGAMYALDALDGMEKEDAAAAAAKEQQPEAQTREATWEVPLPTARRRRGVGDSRTRLPSTTDVGEKAVRGAWVPYVARLRKLAKAYKHDDNTLHEGLTMAADILSRGGLSIPEEGE